MQNLINLKMIILIRDNYAEVNNGHLVLINLIEITENHFCTFTTHKVQLNNSKCV